MPRDLLCQLTRGLFDGDRSVDCYVDRPIKQHDETYLYQRLHVRFNSASRAHCECLRQLLLDLLGIRGAILVQKQDPHDDLFLLRYAKYASILLLTWLYSDSDRIRLDRKFAAWHGFVQREQAGIVLYRRDGRVGERFERYATRRSES